jgi:putative endonuclease
MYFVYIIRCKDGTMYTGITTDVKRRFLEHKNGKGGHYTSSRGVTKLLYTEKRANRSSASKREAQIKRLNRKEKINLIKSPRASRAR